jgi:hypothetical protein
MNTGINLQFKQEEPMKKLTFMNIKEENILDREEMRNIMAGCGGSGGGCYTCDGGECKPYTGSNYGGWTNCTTNGWGACIMSGAGCEVV